MPRTLLGRDAKDLRPDDGAIALFREGEPAWVSEIGIKGPLRRELEHLHLVGLVDGLPFRTNPLHDPSVVVGQQLENGVFVRDEILVAALVGPQQHAQGDGRTGALLAFTDPTARLSAVLLVDAANVIGSRPDGWWRDRSGAARRFVEEVRAARRAGRLQSDVVIVLEGKARAGAAEGEGDDVLVVHAAGEGDDTLAQLAAEAAEPVTLVSADRGLRERTQAVGAEVVGPRWLLERLEVTEIERRHQDAINAGEPGYADPDTGLFVFTSAYHLERGTCCDSSCRHCPYEGRT